MPFVAGPDGAGVGDRILSKFARIQQLGMIDSRLVLGDIDLIFKVNTEKSLLNLCQKLLKFTLSSQ